MSVASEQTSLLWAQRDGSVYRVWMTPRTSGGSSRGAGGAVIHFADLEWKQVGSTPVGSGTQLWHLTREEMEDLLRRAIGKE